MLYVTTINEKETVTTNLALASDRGADGGLYIPFQLPSYTREELAAIAEQSFSQTVAQVLNHFFACRLNAVDVDFCIGRSPVRLAAMNHRVVMAETWHNVENDYDYIQRELCKKVCSSLGAPYKQTSWLCIAVRIAVLVGIFGKLQGLGAVSKEQPVDVAVPTGDFSVAMAVWYARKMGLPISNIICSCNENSGIWELLHLGELHTDAATVTTTTPLADFGVAENVERLICATFGPEETARYLQVKERGRVYRPDIELTGDLRDGMFSAVVSRSRLDALIPSVYRTNAYVLGPYSALSYGGLMDYRAKTGENRPALILADRSPLCDGEMVCASMQMDMEQLEAALNKA